MFNRRKPALRSAWACSASRMPLVVSAMSRMPGTWASFCTNTGKPCRTSGSPPVSRTLLTPIRATTRTNRSISSKVSISCARLEPHVFGRHAIEAADVAAIRDADPQVRMHAAERHRRVVSEMLRGFRLAFEFPAMCLHDLRLSACWSFRHRHSNLESFQPGWTHWLSPSAQFSFFQIGTTSFSVSISHWPASKAAWRCAVLTATATLASPISTWPRRCTIAQPTSGQRRAGFGFQLGQLFPRHFRIALVIERARFAVRA